MLTRNAHGKRTHQLRTHRVRVTSSRAVIQASKCCGRAGHSNHMLGDQVNGKVAAKAARNASPWHHLHQCHTCSCKLVQEASARRRQPPLQILAWGIKQQPDGSRYTLHAGEFGQSSLCVDHACPACRIES